MMKTDREVNLMTMEMLKNILSMAEKPYELSAYITEQIKELIGCKLVALVIHDENNGTIHHQLIGICLPGKKDTVESALIERIAEFSHELHSPEIIYHDKNGTELEKLFFRLGGTCSVAVPLEYSKHREGLLLMVDLLENNNLQSVLNSLEVLSGVLALELRNSVVLQNLENIVSKRTRELSESEKRYRSIIEQATDSMFLCNLAGKIMDVNNQACISVGYTRSELLQMNITDLDAVYMEQEKADKILEQIRTNGSLQLESFHRHKDGSTFPVDIKSNAIELNGEQHIIGFVRDSTDRKHAEEKIIRIGKHYQALIDKAPDGIALISASGEFKFVSPAAKKMFGYSVSDEIVGNPAEYTHPDDLQLVFPELARLTREPAYVPTIQYRFIDKSGNWKWIESTFTNLLADPAVESIVINFRDITERKKAEQEIQELNTELENKVIQRTKDLEERTKQLLYNEKALLNLVEDLNEKTIELSEKTIQLEVTNKELEAFSYSVSHDLRAPLRAINGFATILLDEYESKLDYEGKRLIHVIQSNALKMGKLIDDLLSFSRLIRTELHQTPTDMEQLINQILSDLKLNHEKPALNISLDKIHPAFCDTNMIRQVWVNLISNAIKYSSLNKNALIRISSEKKENEIIYSVTDNGIGFDMNYVHKLFGVFQRLHNIKEIEGTGVGLAIIQRIVTRHGGRVWAEGKVNKGAKFYFTLPCTEVYSGLS